MRLFQPRPVRVVMGWVQVKPPAPQGEFCRFPVCRWAGPGRRTRRGMVVQGVAVCRVSGGAASYFSTTKGSTETVYIAPSGTPLPVSVSANSGNGVVTTCTFSNWNEPVDLAAPPHSFPLTSIPGA
jgi:hypothetical protein